jgi:hypothetical protein
MKPIKLKSSYIGSRSYKDDIEINSTNILFTAYRNSKIRLDDVLYNHTSSMYIQTLKSIIFYYLTSKTYVEIDSIEMKRFKKDNDHCIESMNLSYEYVNQILTSNFKVFKNIQSNRLIKLFDNDEKGEAILIASSYITKASSIEDEIETFERLWKAFNKLYKYIGKNKNEMDCHIELRKFILAHPEKFILSINKIKKLTSEELRTKLRWRALVLNDYNNIKKTKAFHKFILRYTDKRIMKLFTDILPYRKDNLVDQKLFNSVNEHIALNMKQNAIKDTEIVSILCIKYMYFVRNKLMHGEKLDSTFRLIQNKEVKEIQWLNSILEALIIDLINCNDSF